MLITTRFLWPLCLLAGLTLAGCSSIGLGLSVPLGGFGSVGVSADNSGRVGGGVAVGRGGVSVGVGGSGRLPQDARASDAAASAPAGAASSPG